MRLYMAHNVVVRYKVTLAEHDTRPNTTEVKLSEMHHSLLNNHYE